MVRSCGRFLTDSAHLRLSYCNSFERVCQEVSRMKICDAVIKEKGKPYGSLLSRTYKRDKLTKVKVNLQISVEMNMVICYNMCILYLRGAIWLFAIISYGNF